MYSMLRTFFYKFSGTMRSFHYQSSIFFNDYVIISVFAINFSTMAAIFTTFDITENEACRIHAAIQKHTQLDGKCIIWTGACASDGYGILRIVFRGSRLKVKVHRMMYFLYHAHALSPEMHVSHLCHKKTCIKTQHLSYEPQAINNNRKMCKSQGECCGHYGYNNCQL